MWHTFKEFPPVACRLLARTSIKGWSQRPLTDKEIADSSGLPIWKVRSLSELFTWDDTDLNTIKSFTFGCGIDFDNAATMADNRRLARDRLPDTKNHYLRRDPDWETRWMPLLTAYSTYLDEQSHAQQ